MAPIADFYEFIKVLFCSLVYLCLCVCAGCWLAAASAATAAAAGASWGRLMCCVRRPLLDWTKRLNGKADEPSVGHFKLNSPRLNSSRLDSYQKWASCLCAQLARMQCAGICEAAWQLVVLRMDGSEATTTTTRRQHSKQLTGNNG